MERLKLEPGQTLDNYLFFVLLLIIAGCGDKSGVVNADSVITGTTLTWDAPTTNVDGSDLTDLAGYRLYYKKAKNDSYSSTDAVDVGDVIKIGINDVSAISSGTTYYFTVTAYDTSGNESDYSNEVSVKIP